MPWPWTLTFWPQNLISSSLSRDAPVTKVSRKSVNRYWRYRGNIKLPRESWTHGRTHARTDGRMHGRMTRKHIASAGAYRRRRLKNINNNNNNHDNVYGAVIIAQLLREFTRFIWWMWNGAKWLPILRPGQMTWAVSPPGGCQKPHPPLPFIITQLESWYLFYHPTECRRLSQPRHCSKGVQPVPKAVHRRDVYNKHATAHGGIRMLVLSHRSQACYR